VAPARRIDEGYETKEQERHMSGAMRDFGRAELLGAEALGEPGARRFRLFARGRRGETASLWMEKEQLEALSVAMERLLAHASGRMALRREASADRGPLPSAPADFPEQATVEFVVGQMQIGYDPDEEMIFLRASSVDALLANDTPSADEFDPEISIAASRTQIANASADISGALTGGRPRCPLCGRPMQEGHVCDKQNGYHPVGLN
jgi:uncharacterized repeat protein (TIGR03847 family)